MKKILLVGGGSHFNSCVDIFKNQKKYKIGGFVDRNKKNLLKNDIKWLGYDENLSQLRKKFIYAHVSVGHIKDLNLREKIFNKLIKLNFKLPKILSSYSYVSNSAKIDCGTIVMHRAVINTNAKIGKNCIINTGSIIEHDVIIGDHCHVSTGAIINGGTIIGNNTFVGSGSVVKQKIKVGSKCFINANIFVKKNLNNNSTLK